MGLRRAGYTVDVAGNAAEARQLLATQSYGVVVADWLMQFEEAKDKQE